MEYMARHAELRLDPQQLLPGTISVLSVTLDYWPEAEAPENILNTPEKAYISRYTLGRDYHKVIRNRLQKLGQRIADALAGQLDAPLIYRAFSDSAPVLEVAFASQTRLGWRGKHSLLLSRRGSWQFLGELYLGLELPPDLPKDTPPENHCGTCTRCITACPTGAILAPGQVDARHCISYLTIELAGSIPEELRPLLGNRIYGCDDCQLTCPWNRFAQLGDPEFAVRHNLDNVTLETLFAWTESEFEQKLAGSPIRRIGHTRWLRNIAVALGNVGNGPATPSALVALQSRLDHPEALVREHVGWAINRLKSRKKHLSTPCTTTP